MAQKDYEPGRSSPHEETASAQASTGESGPPAGTPPAPPRRLVRLPEEGPLAGVAAGLGAYFGVDPVVLRIAFIVLVFAGGVGLLLYLALWLAMPHGSRAEVGGPATNPNRTAQWVGIGLIVVALLWLTAQLDLLSAPLILALTLVAVGVLLLVQGRSEAGTVTAPPQQGQPPYTAGPGQPPDAPGQWQPPHVPGPPPPPQGPAASPAVPQSPPPPPRSRSLLGRLTFGAILVALGLAALLDNAGVVDLTLRHYLALALLGCGAGLLVGAWWGRSRGLIVAGALLLPILLVVSAFQVLAPARTLAEAGEGPVIDVRGGIGERVEQPGELDEVSPAYRLGAGELTVDLSEVEFTEPTTVQAHVGTGSLTVVVPHDAVVDARARTNIGEVDVLGASAGGIGRVDRHVVDGDEPDLTLRLSTGIGEVHVVRAVADAAETDTHGEEG